MSRRGPLMVALAATIWGSWSLFLRPAEAISPISPFAETLVVQMAASCVAMPMAWLRRRRTKRSLRAWSTLVFSGASDTAAGVLFFLAMSVTSLAIATLTHYLAPIFVAIAAPWLDKRPYTWGALLASCTAIAGLALMLEPWHGSSVTGGGVGAAAGAASAVFYALIVLFSKNAGEHFSSWEVLAWQRLVSVVVMLPFALSEVLHLQLRQVGLLLCGGALINGFAGMLFFAGLQRCRAEQASALTLMEPLTAIVLGWAVWHEQLGIAAMAGAALILASLYGVVTRAPAPAPETVA